MARAAKLLVVAVSRLNRVHETLIPCAFSVVAGTRTHGKITVSAWVKNRKNILMPAITKSEHKKPIKRNRASAETPKKTAGQIVDGSPLWMSLRIIQRIP